MKLPDIIPILSLVISIAALVGGYLAYRQGYSKQASAIQDRVITALQNQNKVQEEQIEGCEKEIARLKRVVTTIQLALKRRGLRIEIDRDAISLIDEGVSKQEQVIQISVTDKSTGDDTEGKKVQP